jgi:hypothetical protein
MISSDSTSTRLDDAKANPLLLTGDGMGDGVLAPGDHQHLVGADLLVAGRGHAQQQEHHEQDTRHGYDGHTETL